jgi:hypothetical protein
LQAGTCDRNAEIHNGITFYFKPIGDETMTFGQNIFWGVLILSSSHAYADRAEPRVKVQIEVIVFDDGDVEVRRGKKHVSVKKKSIKRIPKSEKCCSDKSCNKCRANTQTRNKSKGKISKQMVARVAKNIMELDQNKDGRLNADEVSSRLKTPFSQVDRNGDGYLDSGEVRAQVLDRMKNNK